MIKTFDFETLDKYLNKLNNEVSELKRKTSESSSNTKPYKPLLKKISNPPLESSQSSNVNLNVEQLGMDNY